MKRVRDYAAEIRAAGARWCSRFNGINGENRMTEPIVVPTPPVMGFPDGAPTPPTLIQTLNAKLKAAQATRAAADQAVKDLEDEIKALPKHLHDLTFADMMGKVDGWFK